MSGSVMASSSICGNDVSLNKPPARTRGLTGRISDRTLPVPANLVLDTRRRRGCEALAKLTSLSTQASHTAEWVQGIFPVVLVRYHTPKCQAWI